MAGNKYLERNSTTGRMTEVESNDTSAGVGDAGKVVALNASGEIDSSMLPANIGDNAVVVEADEALSAGDLVEIFDDGGTPKARLASAASGTVQPAVGFVNAAFAAAANATVFFEGTITGLAGLTPGQRVYLSTSSAGDVQTAVPSGAGNIQQFVGKALSTTELNFEPDDVIVLA